MVLDNLHPITAETSMILRGQVFVQALPSLEGMWVDVGHMKHVIWDVPPPSRHTSRVSEQIMNDVHSFVRPGVSRNFQLRYRVGAVFTIRSQSPDSVSVLEGKMFRFGNRSILAQAYADGQSFTA